MAPPPPRLPVGFFLSGMLSMAFTAVMLFLLVLGETDTGAGNAVVFRGVAVLLASLGAITTEALWKVRREAWAASVALAVCFAAWVMGLAAADDFLGGGVVALAICSLVVGPILRYLYVRSRQMWPPAGVRVPAPRP